MSEVNITNMSKLQVKKISELSDIITYNGVNNTGVDLSELSIPQSISILLANETTQGDLLKDNYKIKLYDIFTNIKNWVSTQINNLSKEIDKTKDYIESNLKVTNINTEIPNNYIEVKKTTNGKNIDYDIKLDVIENIDNENNGLITKDKVVYLLNKDKWDKI